ncbi:uncharacterized protein LOC129615183 [Condylostylus longicornis]|uniref:uncharacterized protein LOC129615183 n=1 Tax=Condylostylus longicornis TaxID=2530218 RepID=UPI00244DEE71|nr:uncharacterized protein LOC129615183 [Condylostylus longicornis]
MDCSNSRDEFSAKTAQKFVLVNASESPILRSSSNSNEISTNSTDNLSYSPHDHVDEIIFQNTLSDDDEHGSVDCIYAYRGAGADRDEEQIVNINENDDETDFLEMDFDPDPPSEIEQNQNICNISSFDEKELFEKEILLMNEQLLKNVEKFSSKYNNTGSNNEIEKIVQNSSTEDLDDQDELEINKEKINESNIEAKFESTGAKPKKNVENKLINGNFSCNVNHKNKKQLQAQRSYELCANEKLKAKNKTISNSIISNDKNQAYNKDYYETADDICLDCLEKEFLSKIIGKDVKPITLCNKCKLNQNRSLKTFCESSIIHVNNNNINLQSLERFNKYEALDLISFSVNNRTDLHLSELEENSKILTCDNINVEPFLGSIKISSINYDATTLIQALTKLNIEYDESIIFKHLDKQKTDFLNICDFIIYSSKKNCNYRKLMKTINLASKDKIKLEFQFDDAKVNEIVHVKAYDILYYWQINNDLSGIKKLSRRFKEMNVLGKLVNKIRQAQQRTTKHFNDYITIPQYYRSGYITITKA